MQTWGALSLSGHTRWAAGSDPFSGVFMLSWWLLSCPELPQGWWTSPILLLSSSVPDFSVLLIFAILPHFVLLITVDGMGTAFFFHVVWFTPLQSCYCLEKLPHFHLQHPFSHHFQFLQLLFHFGFHRNHMSLQGSISNMLAASALIGHNDNIWKTPSIWAQTWQTHSNKSSDSQVEPLVPSVGAGKSWRCFTTEWEWAKFHL